jgi:TetR/AcrR family transcriptional regulator
LTLDRGRVYRRTARYDLVNALSPSPRTTVDGDAVRRRVLDAAERVFAERGYAGATTREIADAAGIRKRMLFYYVPSKQALYRAVLERVVHGLVAIHEQFRNDPGPVGLAEAMEGITLFAVAHRPALKLLLRDIVDGGPHLPALARDTLGPLFARGAAEVRRNMERGVFAPADPMHVLVNVGGLTLFYVLIAPLLELIWSRDPLAPETLAERAAVVRDCLMHGLAGAAGRRGMP